MTIFSSNLISETVVKENNLTIKIIKFIKNMHMGLRKIIRGKEFLTKVFSQLLSDRKFIIILGKPSSRMK